MQTLSPIRIKQKHLGPGLKMEPRREKSASAKWNKTAKLKRSPENKLMLLVFKETLMYFGKKKQKTVFNSVGWLVLSYAFELSAPNFLSQIH